MVGSLSLVFACDAEKQQRDQRVAGKQWCSGRLTCADEGAGKELHHSLSSDVIVSCLHRKEVASEAVLVSIAISAEEGDYLGRDGRSTTGEDKGCWVEPCFKDGLVGFGFGSLKLCCQGLEEAQDFKGSSSSKA